MICLLKKPLWIFQSGWKEIRKHTSGNSMSPLGAQNKDLGAALQALLTLNLNYVISLASRLSPVPASACSPLSLGKASGRAAEEKVLWGMMVLHFLCVSVFGSLYLFSILWFCFYRVWFVTVSLVEFFVFPFWQMCFSFSYSRRSVLFPHFRAFLPPLSSSPLPLFAPATQACFQWSSALLMLSLDGSGIRKTIVSHVHFFF